MTTTRSRGGSWPRRCPTEIVGDLVSFLDRIRYPLAVRSSSLLEDSQYQPFAGIYSTFMLANDHADPDVRLAQLQAAIKRVYASTFSRHAKAYLSATPYRLEEEKMAVILQQLVGSPHGPRFYPTFAGVARSHNFYPVPPMAASDGVAAVALRPRRHRGGRRSRASGSALAIRTTSCSSRR